MEEDSVNPRGRRDRSQPRELPPKGLSNEGYPKNSKSGYHKNISPIGISTPTTTATLCRVRGFTIDLLFELKNQGLRTTDIIDSTGKTRWYVSRYLYNMRNYGLVKKTGPFWNLTEEGSLFLSYLESIGTNTNRMRKIAERKLKEGRKIAESSSSKKPKQISIELWLHNSNLDETETVVVEVLVDHYNRTGGKFLWFTSFHDLAERLKVSPSLLPQALRKLSEDQIIYVWRNKKIGLKTAFIEAVRLSKKGGSHR